MVRLLPAAASLRAAWPEAHISWLVEPAAASILEGQPWLDDVLVFPRGRLRAQLRRVRPLALGRETLAFVRTLRDKRFDLVIDFHSILKSGVLSRLSGAPRRIGYAPPFGREGAWWFATDTAQLAPARVSRFERNAGLLHFLGVEPKPEPGALHVPEDRRRHYAENLPQPAPVALHPGTSPGTPHKRWQAARYGVLARAIQERTGVPSVVSFGPSPAEREQAQAVVAASAGAAGLAPPTPSLPDLAALLASCRLYVGGDTGPMHLASLVGTPVVQLLGPTDPVENAPYPGTASRSVRVPVACSPCRRGCAAATCMRVIQHDQVLDAALTLLAAHPAG